MSGRRHRGHDCVLDGLKVEVKTSLRWNNDRFVFFRLHDFDYHAVAFLGIEPDNVQLWIVPKAIAWHHAREQLRASDAIGTKWISFFSTQPPRWLEPWGGSFAQARRALRDATGYRHQDTGNEPPSPHGSADDEAWLQLAAQIDWPWHSTPSDHIEHQHHSQRQQQPQPQKQEAPITHTERNDTCQ